MLSLRAKLAWAALATAAMLLPQPDAKADNPGFPGYGGDVHIPNAQMGYCPGGGFLRLTLGVLKGYCDGADYPDGSFWHQVPGTGAPWFARLDTSCRLHTRPDLGYGPARKLRRPGMMLHVDDCPDCGAAIMDVIVYGGRRTRKKHVCPARSPWNLPKTPTTESS